MGMTTTTVASGDPTLALGRGRTGRSGDDQGAQPGGFAAALGAAETAATPPVEAQPPRRENAAQKTAERDPAERDPADGTDGVQDADAEADDRAPAVPGKAKRRATAADGTTADPAVTTTAQAPASAVATETTPAQAALAGATQAATAASAVVQAAAPAAGAATPAADKILGAGRGANPAPADARGVAAGAARATTPGGATATAATAAANAAATALATAATAAATTASAAAADADRTPRTAATPVVDPMAAAAASTQQPVELARAGQSAALAAGAARADAVPLYQSNFARMQQALAHAPAGGKGAAADAVDSMAQDLGAMVTALTGSTPVGQAVASTVSLADGAGRAGGSLINMAALVRPAEVAGAGAGRPGDSGGQAGQGAQGDSGAGSGLGAPGLGFGATAALDGGSWNNGMATATAAGASAPGLETRSAEEVLADQIGSWVHKRTQSAELTLDAFGGSPVDVRISMTGSEAQVAFQSDNEATRQMLGGAVDQLRDLLQSQGLVLSGVSVGGSGASQTGGQPGSGEGRPNGRGRGATAEVEGIGEAAPANRGPSAVSQRAVDVFI